MQRHHDAHDRQDHFAEVVEGPEDQHSSVFLVVADRQLSVVVFSLLFPAIVFWIDFLRQTHVSEKEADCVDWEDGEDEEDEDGDDGVGKGPPVHLKREVQESPVDQGADEANDVALDDHAF